MTRIVLVICTLFCLAVVAFGVHLVVEQQQRIQQLSATTTATILEERLERHEKPFHHRASGGQRSQHDWFYYEPVITFRFEAQGRQVTSHNVFPEPSRMSGNLGFMAAKAPLDRFHVGQKTTAYYNRRNPSDVCLIRRPSISRYFPMLAPVIALSFLVCLLWRPPPLPPQRKAALKRRTALRLAALWHTLGIAAAAHYLWLAGRDNDGVALSMLALYAQLGLIPIALAMPPAHSSPLAGRIKGVIVCSLLGSFLGFWIGLLIGWAATTFFSASASTFFRCWGYSIAITAALLAPLGLTAQWHPPEEEPQPKSARPS